MFVGQPVWMPLYSVFWLHSRKPVFPAALCRATSDSWTTSHASVTPSLQSTSAQTTLVRLLRTLEIITFWGFSLVKSGHKDVEEYIHLATHKQLTSWEFSFFSHLCYIACLLSFWVFTDLTLLPFHKFCVISFFFCRRPLASSLSRSSPTCSGNNGCQPTETNSACKQRVQLNRKGASAFLFYSLHGFTAAFERCSLNCTYIYSVSY